MTHQIAVANCDIEYWTGCPTQFGHGRSFLYLNGSKLGLTWTKNYVGTGVTYLSVASHPNVSSSNYSPDMSIYLVRIIKGEMSDVDIVAMHT